MRSKATTMIVVAIIAALPVLNLYAWSQMPQYTQENAIDEARRFIKVSPTYAFDGIEDSLEVIKVERISDDTWRIFFAYTSRHAGYGDRSGQVLLPVLMEHETVVTIVAGEVVRAVTDGVYDELEGQVLPTQVALDYVKGSPTYVFDGLPESLKVVEVSSRRAVQDGDLHGTVYDVLVYFESGYSGYGDRSGEMLLPVVTPHEVSLVISEGQVVSAVMDGTWDMQAQQFIE